MTLDRPIFLVGHARGGSTALAAIINWHSHVGPKPDVLRHADNVNAFISAILNKTAHITYSSELEQKDIWFNYFPGNDIFTHMGKELVTESWHGTRLEAQELARRLAEKCHEKRFLSKARTNSFRVRCLPEVFPGAKVLALYRSAPEVVASWGKRSYGFNKPVSWGSFKRARLSYVEGIRIFARKWCETIEYLETQRRAMGFMAICYDDLIENTAPVLSRVFRYLDLPLEAYSSDITLEDRRHAWRAGMPLHYQWLLKAITWRGMRLYRAARSEAQADAGRV